MLLHGGPACTHEYFEYFESFLPAAGIEFIYYDQLGSAYSDQPSDTSLWALPRFVDEVEQVRKALGLNKDNFFLLGHSWGGILAMQYALQYQDNLKGLIISNMMASCPAYDRYAEEVLAKQIPSAVLQELMQLEAQGDFANPKYMEWMAGQMSKGQFLLCPNGSHMCMWDDQEHYFPGLIEFLREHASYN